MRRTLTALILSNLLAAGCSTAKLPAPAAPPPDPGMALEATTRIREANTLLASGETGRALQLYEQALADYQSPDGALESALLTNAALASLQTGNRERFLHYADELKRQSAGLRFLPRNIQMVLALAAEFRLERLEQDYRIDAGVRDAVATAMGKKTVGR